MLCYDSVVQTCLKTSQIQSEFKTGHVVRTSDVRLKQLTPTSVCWCHRRGIHLTRNTGPITQKTATKWQSENVHSKFSTGVQDKADDVREPMTMLRSAKSLMTQSWGPDDAPTPQWTTTHARHRRATGWCWMKNQLKCPSWNWTVKSETWTVSVKKKREKHAMMLCCWCLLFVIWTLFTKRDLRVFKAHFV